MSNYYLFIILFIYLILNKREKKRNFVKKVILFLANKKVKSRSIHSGLNFICINKLMESCFPILLINTYFH